MKRFLCVLLEKVYVYTRMSVHLSRCLAIRYLSYLSFRFFACRMSLKMKKERILKQNNAYSAPRHKCQNVLMPVIFFPYVLG